MSKPKFKIHDLNKAGERREPRLVGQQLGPGAHDAEQAGEVAAVAVQQRVECVSRPLGERRISPLSP